MFIKEIEMCNNTRLMIRGTTYIKLTFTEIAQLILGTNGCGKSTIIYELSPLPPSGNDYLKGGYKKILIEHRDKIYTLTSRFTTQAGKHSFIDNETDEELNPGGTQSVQRTLISEVFNYDQPLHDILTDQLKFTDMSPLQRRTWLTRISGTNLDFVIELFNKLKKAERDEEAVVGHLTKRLNKESDNLPTTMELDALQDRFHRLDKQLKEFYQYRVHHIKAGSNELFTMLEVHVNKMKVLSLNMLSAEGSKNTLGINSIEELQDYGSRLGANINNVKQRIEENYKEHSEITRLLSETEHVTDEKTLIELKTALEDHYATIRVLKSRLTLIKECDNSIETYGRARSINGIIIDYVTDFADNSEGYFTKDKRVETENNVAHLNTLLNKQSRTISDCEHSISHILKTEDTVCPKCNHTFKHGVRVEDLPKYKATIVDAEKKVIELQKQKDVLTVYLDEYTIYRNNYIRYMDTLNANKDLDFLNKHIRPIDLLVSSPRLILDTYRTCLNDLEAHSKIEYLMPEIFKLEAFIDKVNSVRSSGNYTESRLIKIEDTINELSQQQTIYERELVIIKKDYDSYMNLSQQHQLLTKQFDIITNELDNIYTSSKSEVIEEVISRLNLELSQANTEYTNARNRQNIVDDVSRSRDETMDKSRIYKILVNEINPTTGLIADYFKQFINQFVEQMNVIINKVWEHHIELLPCEVNSEGITYKFPLRINDKPYGPSDGAKGSNSQISMVNFAFKIVVMVYLGLDDYPLYLDELAPDLDEKHRINIISFVRGFVESKRCSQMFLVSHYASGYGAFTNAQILVLDEDNLLNVPDTYNTHAKIIKDETIAEEDT